MIFTELSIKGVFSIELEPLEDSRGMFVRNFCKNELAAIGFKKDIVQINHSVTKKKGSFRGLHYQINPFAEIKMVRCLKGAVADFVVDIRKDSHTFLKWIRFDLIEDNYKMIYIPKGFAHGFQTLTDNCELLYFHSEFYNPSAEAALNYLDPSIDLTLPLAVSDISERDKNHPFTNKNFTGVEI